MSPITPPTRPRRVAKSLVNYCRKFTARASVARLARPRAPPVTRTPNCANYYPAADGETRGARESRPSFVMSRLRFMADDTEQIVGESSEKFDTALRQFLD